MDVLVIGGSVFVGRNVVSEAQRRGDRVTVFNRGVSAPQPGGVEHIRGDRTDPGDLRQLAGRRFDVVVDTCGYVPADVARTAELLRESEGETGRYSFVSTVNVYPGWPEQADYHHGGVHHGDPDATADDVPAAVGPEGAYGWLKAGCELAVQRAFGDRAQILRGGCIVGPYDAVTGRLPWWIDRVARGGRVLVPGRPDDPLALIDARDLAHFALTGPPGVYEATGPATRDTFGDLLTIAREVTGSDAEFGYVDGRWLVEQGVEPWTEIPLWAGPDAPSVFRHDPSTAAAAGLTWRPLRETIRDTWAWQQSLPQGWTPGPRTPGLAADREANLLQRAAETMQNFRSG